MKRIRFILILLAILPFNGAFAQTGEIIYRDFEPDTALHVGGQPTVVSIDFDKEAPDDIIIRWVFESPGVYVDLFGRDQFVTIFYAEVGDTISNITEWTSGTAYPHLHDNWAVRIEKDGEYYYGWFKTYVNYEPFVVNDFCFDKIAYCTIPNYPLVWGQTELHDDVSESGIFEFACVLPNPTTGIFTVTGENLNQIEVIDVLGQRITSLTANSDLTTIDLSGQPAGVYLVTVTDHDGKQCVKKVVRQ